MDKPHHKLESTNLDNVEVTVLAAPVSEKNNNNNKEKSEQSQG